MQKIFIDRIKARCLNVLLLVLLFMASCSTDTKENSKSAKEDIDTPKAKEKKIVRKDVSAQEIPWMYMDDSLKNMMRPLNFKLPWMASDIRILPEMITPEILGLAPLKSFELWDKSNGAAGDSLYYFRFRLKRGDCDCEVLRIYKGNPNDKNFDGYFISEQIICNSLSANQDFKEPYIPVGDTTADITYEIQGHEH